MILDLFLINWLLIGLILAIIWSIWDTPGRSLREDEGGFNEGIWIIVVVAGVFIWWFFSNQSIANQKDPAWLMSQAIKLSKEGAKLIEQSLVLVTTFTVSQQTSNVELENLSYETSGLTEDVIPEAIVENTTISRFSYYQEISSFIIHHPWLTLIGISTFGLSGWYLYSQYNRRQRLNSLVFRPINLFVWLSGLFFLGGSTYLYYKGYDHLYLKQFYDNYQLWSKILKTATTTLKQFPPPPEELSFLFLSRKSKIMLGYIGSLFICFSIYVLNFISHSSLTVRYSESAKLSNEIHQKTIKLKKLAQIEQEQMNLFVKSLDQSSNDSLVKLAQDYSIQNKQTTEIACKLTEKISQADKMMVQACQNLNANSSDQINLGQRQTTFKEYFIDSFEQLLNLPKSSYILLIFLIILIFSAFYSRIDNFSQASLNQNKTIQTQLDFSFNLLIGGFISLIILGLFYLSVSVYVINLFPDEVGKLILIRYTETVGLILTSFGLTCWAFLTPLTIRLLLLESGLSQNQKQLISLVGTIILLLFFLFDSLTLGYFCYFFFLFIIILI